MGERACKEKGKENESGSVLHYVRTSKSQTVVNPSILFPCRNEAWGLSVGRFVDSKIQWFQHIFKVWFTSLVLQFLLIMVIWVVKVNFIKFIYYLWIKKWFLWLKYLEIKVQLWTLRYSKKKKNLYYLNPYLHST